MCGCWETCCRPKGAAQGPESVLLTLSGGSSWWLKLSGFVCSLTSLLLLISHVRGTARRAFLENNGSSEQKNLPYYSQRLLLSSLQGSYYFVILPPFPAPLQLIDPGVGLGPQQGSDEHYWALIRALYWYPKL